MDNVSLAKMLMQFSGNREDGYDYSAYTNKYGRPTPYKSFQDYLSSTGKHLGDEFKTPEHITFSDGSVYSSPDMKGGTWQSGGSEKANLWNFNPSETNLKQFSPAQLADYFKNYERKNTFVTLPDGRMIEGSR